ncbi:MAG: hypothetical protein ACXW3Z_00940 [Limisphaerales bacterium]
MSALKAVAENVWEAVTPLKIPGLRMDHRMTVVRLSNGELLIHSPVEYSYPLAKEILELGKVQWFVAPSRFHDMYWPKWFRAFSKTRSAAVRGVKEDHPELPFSDVLEGGSAFWDGELEILPLRGAPKLNEVALLHPDSGSLIVADLLFNIDAHAQNLLGRLFLKANGICGRPGISRIFRSYVKDKAAFQESLRQIQQRDFQRIILGHGPNLGGNEVLAHALHHAGITGASEPRQPSNLSRTASL